ncbi:MAG: type I restriction enzyme HsdR N-terminal domain-containing protein [Flavobacteriaceae bacterium]|nr:type I restriction enzyme HsdR N-terminal domain-containing protein [Flavobacteriaceae bacterium]
MQELNLPNYQFRIKSNENKLFIFDFIRKKEVVLTPEEWVRQHFLMYLVTEKKYPASLIAVEKKLTLNTLTKRTDIVVYNKNAKPEIIVECKAPNVPISQEVFDQIARYNLKLEARFLVVTNGLQHFYCQIDTENETYFFLEDIPNWTN